MFENVLFDLDGTLSDPFEGISNSIVYALNKFGIEVPDKSVLKPFIGPPLFESFSRFYGFSEADAVRAVGYYREYYGEKGIYENRLYDGIADVLAELKSSGKKLIVATSKPEVFSVKIIEYFALDKYFEFTAGATFDKTRIEKADVIKYALDRGGIAASSAVMVGDRKHDISGAKSNGLKSIGVLYGFGDREELETAGADCIVKSPRDILSVVL
ncbi:MAG: HAD family hydrolase [Roseburia sp.]|nr:HAD family hydrolase [Roseburia sp.]